MWRNDYLKDNIKVKHEREAFTNCNKNGRNEDLVSFVYLCMTIMNFLIPSRKPVVTLLQRCPVYQFYKVLHISIALDSTFSGISMANRSTLFRNLNSNLYINVPTYFIWTNILPCVIQLRTVIHDFLTYNAYGVDCYINAHHNSYEMINFKYATIIINYLKWCTLVIWTFTNTS